MIKKVKANYRSLIRYLKYHDDPKLDKFIVLCLIGERRFFNIFYYARTKIRSYLINRVYKYHTDHRFT